MNDVIFMFAALAFLGFMMFYSSRKRKKAAETLRSSIKKGSYVMLTSGIFGKISAVEETKVVLETAPGQRLVVAIGAVRSIEEEPKPVAVEKASTKPKAASTIKGNTKEATKPASSSSSKSKSTNKTK